jgi:hypothetical protein
MDKTSSGDFECGTYDRVNDKFSRSGRIEAFRRCAVLHAVGHRMRGFSSPDIKYR